VPATDPAREEVARECGRLAIRMLKDGRRPSQLITRPALLNAIAAVMATGGSTNAVLHLLAVAQEAKVELALEDFDRVSARTPLLADMKPWGRFTAPDLGKAGGIMLVMQRLLEAGVVDGNAMTVTGRTLAEEARAVRETPGQQVVTPLAKPLAPSGGMVIVRGSLAPEGAVLKVAGEGMPTPPSTTGRPSGGTLTPRRSSRSSTGASCRRRRSGAASHLRSCSIFRSAAWWITCANRDRC